MGDAQRARRHSSNARASAAPCGDTARETAAPTAEASAAATPRPASDDREGDPDRLLAISNPAATKAAAAETRGTHLAAFLTPASRRHAPREHAPGFACASI